MRCVKSMNIDSCTPDTGPPVPSGPNAFDIVGEIVRSTVTINAFSECDPLIGFYPDLFDYFVSKSIPENLPPGEYELAYVSGTTEEFNAAGPCGGPGTVNWPVVCYGIYDSEHLFSLIAWPTGLTENIHTVSPLGPPEGAGDFACETNLASALTDHNNYFIVGIGAPRRWMERVPRTNTGGACTLIFPIGQCPIGGCVNTYMEVVPANPLVFEVIQVSGQKDMVTALYIVDWPNASVDPDINNFWDGTFPTRDAYTSSTCEFDVAALGPFGGASIAYSQAVPSSPNNCAWVLTIRLGFANYWVGYKVVGEDPTGTYMRDPAFSNGPGCFTVLETI